MRCLDDVDIRTLLQLESDLSDQNFSKDLSSLFGNITV